MHKDHVARVPLVPRADGVALAALRAEGGHAAFLAHHLPVEVPRLVGVGESFDGYPGHGGVWDVDPR